MLGVWVYMVYAIVLWRASTGGPEPVGGPSARGHRRIQSGWILTTTVIVLFLAGFGTYELVQPEGAGGGQGPSPIWTPTSKDVLQIQVIGQQWKWTYRYPTFGGFETNQLVIPVDTTVAFHVTSLDVIHCFWAYQLGVKADANPARTTSPSPRPASSGPSSCAAPSCAASGTAPCTTTAVVSKPQLRVLGAARPSPVCAPNTKLLPPFAYTYIPDANGADGGYYPDNVDPYSKVETYGATQPAGGG